MQEQCLYTGIGMQLVTLQNKRKLQNVNDFV